MPPLPHRVRRLSFEVRASSPGEALALRQVLRDRLDSGLLVAIERAFDASGAYDEIVYIPRLCVQARIAGTGDVAADLARCLEHELGEQLASLRRSSPRLGALELPAGSDSAARGRADLVEPGDLQRADRGPGAPRTRVSMLVQYLETGRLPWPLANLSSTVVIDELREAATDVRGVLDQRLGEPAGFTARVALWFRWLQLLPDASWPAVARAAAGSSGASAVRLTELVAALADPQPAPLSRYARLQLAAAAIVVTRDHPGLAGAPERVAAEPVAAAGLITATELAAVVRAALLAGGTPTAADARSSRGVARRDAPPAGAGPHDPDSRGEAGADTVEHGARDASTLVSRLPEPAAAAFHRWLDADRAGAAAGLGPVAETPSGAGPDGAVARSASTAGRPRGDRIGPADRRERPAGRAEEPPREPRAPALPGAGLTAPHDARASSSPGASARATPLGDMVHHAGLVLLHPFLSRFFEATGVKRAGEPALLPGELPRAAALLDLLATGEPEPLELAIDFAKLLVGVPPDAPLSVAEGLVRASDRDEVDGLLAAVIDHWRALKRTSVHGLRTTFLQRPGLVREEDHGFRLHIEPAAFDVLLGQLPWGISTVKLPWMKKAIFTEWPAP